MLTRGVRGILQPLIMRRWLLLLLLYRKYTLLSLRGSRRRSYGGVPGRLADPVCRVCASAERLLLRLWDPFGRGHRSGRGRLPRSKRAVRMCAIGARPCTGAKLL